MNIRELRILPPLAIARLGSAPEPVVNYTIDDDPDKPLEFRGLKPQETLVVDDATGEISRSFFPLKSLSRTSTRMAVRASVPWPHSLKCLRSRTTANSCH